MKGNLNPADERSLEHVFEAIREEWAKVRRNSRLVVTIPSDANARVSVDGTRIENPRFPLQEENA